MEVNDKPEASVSLTKKNNKTISLTIGNDKVDVVDSNLVLKLMDTVNRQAKAIESYEYQIENINKHVNHLLSELQKLQREVGVLKQSQTRINNRPYS